MLKLSNLKEWQSLSDAAAFLSLSLDEVAKIKDVVQLAFIGKLTLSIHFPELIRVRTVEPRKLSAEAFLAVGKGQNRWNADTAKKLFHDDEIPSSVLADLVEAGKIWSQFSDEYALTIIGMPFSGLQGERMVYFPKNDEDISFRRGVFDLIPVGAGSDLIRNLLTETDQAFGLWFGPILRNADGMYFEAVVPGGDGANWESKSMRDFSPMNRLPESAEIVVRTTELNRFCAQADQGKEAAGASEPRMSDPRLKVLAALIENAGINWSQPRGQAAELQRFVDKTSFGPVSPDLCESIVRAIKDRMPDWD